MSSATPTRDHRRPTDSRRPRFRPGALCALALATACGGDGGSDVIDPIPQDTTDPSFVEVAPPTGSRSTDVQAVLVALGRVSVGGTVQFQEGTYLIGAGYEAIQTAKDGLTIRGHANGTVLRGGDPSLGQQFWGLVLRGGGYTVEGLTFESFVFTGLYLGDYDSGVGGSLVQNSAFVANAIGVIVAGRDAPSTIIRDNDFIDNGSAIFVNGGRANFERNEVHAPDPARVPDAPGDYPPYPFAVAMTWGGVPAANSGTVGPCIGNVFADNNVSGYGDGFMITARGVECSGNVIRGNTVTNQVAFDAIDGASLAWIFAGEGGTLIDNEISGNVLDGSDGLGIVLEGASRTTVTGNQISNVSASSLLSPDYLGGTGIWLWGSDDNEVADNQFTAVEGWHVVLDGDRNSVQLTSATDSVLDLGVDNQVSHPSQQIAGPPPAVAKLRMIRRLQRLLGPPGA